MNKKIIFRNIGLGFLSWLIPFAISFFCYTPNGQLLLEYNTFKALMTVSGTVSGCFLLYHYFKAVNHHFISSAVIVGLSWFALNILLDTAILIPMMKVSFATYFMSIGICYSSIPAISIAMGSVLEKKVK